MSYCPIFLQLTLSTAYTLSVVIIAATSVRVKIIRIINTSRRPSAILAINKHRIAKIFPCVSYTIISVSHTFYASWRIVPIENIAHSLRNAIRRTISHRQAASPPISLNITIQL